MDFSRKISLVSGITWYAVAASNLAQAQILPDGTTPKTSITGDCLTRCEITGGIPADSNLFHSFQEFNLGSGEKVYFVDPGVANIFSRVTGSNVSEIFGTLGVTGKANLWLLNPNGIILGAGATLDVNGSFVATTADSIRFGDRGFFATSGNTQENLPLLTVNPDAFFYEQMGQGNPIIVAPGASLTVPIQESIVLLGAQQPETAAAITISGGTIQAPQGRVEIGAIADNATIGINADFQLELAEAITKGNITLAQGSAIDVSGIGGGSITLQGKEVNILDGSNVTSTTLGNLDGGKIAIAAQQLNIDDGTIASFSFGTGTGAELIINAESIDLRGQGVASYQELINQALIGNLTPTSSFSGMATVAASSGAAGNITLDSSNISVVDGGFIASITYNQGQGGSIEVSATEMIDLSSSSLLSFSAVDSFGDVGNLNINTEKLIVRDGAILSAATLGQGTGGDISIQASELVELRNTPDDFILPTAIFTNSISEAAGNAGNLTIDTQTLVIKEGSQISSASGLLTSEGLIPFGGTGGNVEINASESVTISGSSQNNSFPSAIFSDTRSENPAGKIDIDTGRLLVEGEALISASSINTGNGENLTIKASESVQIVGSGTQQLEVLVARIFSQEISFEDIRSGLFTITVEGEAGTLSIDTPKLTIAEGGLISTTTLGRGQGGDLTINAVESVNIIGSAIASSTAGDGQAGKVTVNTGRLTTNDGGVLTSSTVGQGNAGDLTLNATEAVELLDNQVRTLTSGGISTGSFAGSAQPGNLTINTQKLVIRNGARIDALNVIDPELAAIDNSPKIAQVSETTEININATDSILIEGTSPIDRSPSGILSTTATDTVASDINIKTEQLLIQDNASISVNSTGNGNAGNLTITADAVYLNSGGNLNANTLSGQGGNIVLTLDNLLQLKDNTAITTNAFNQGDGGNINIDTEFLVAFADSQITAKAIAGNGGNINIVAQDLFVSTNSEISASSELGIDGEVNVTTFTNDLRNNLVKLPEKFLKAENTVVASCGADNNLEDNSFVYIGKGGLPPNLFDRNSDSQFLADLGTNNDLANATEFLLPTVKQPENPEVVEATGWLISDRGTVILTAQTASDNFQSRINNH
ncbi:MAG TPA: filamentous hemagglutinin N-terminal domain-containing protein, partial [Xenococcaceae cyanobacterium]